MRQEIKDSCKRNIVPSATKPVRNDKEAKEYRAMIDVMYSALPHKESEAMALLIYSIRFHVFGDEGFEGYEYIHGKGWTKPGSEEFLP